MAAPRFPFVALKQIFLGDTTKQEDRPTGGALVLVFNTGDFVAEEFVTEHGLKVGDDVDYREEFRPAKKQTAAKTPVAKATGLSENASAKDASDK